MDAAAGRRFLWTVPRVMKVRDMARWGKSRSEGAAGASRSMMLPMTVATGPQQLPYAVSSSGVPSRAEPLTEEGRDPQPLAPARRSTNDSGGAV